MTQIIFSLNRLLVLCCLAPIFLVAKPESLSVKDFQPYGRYVKDAEKLELISSASHFGFSFKGEECTIVAYLANASEHNYIQYELDGVYQKRLKITGNEKQNLTIKTPRDSVHTVWIFKATEAHTGPVFIEQVIAENIKSIKKPEMPMIEFIGNSITCAAAADPSEVPCGSGVYHDQHNAYQSYATRLARSLNVNFMLSSVSGIGIYRNWNSDGPAMPQVYEKTDFQDYSTRYWDFKAYTPAVVSIALGTNDFSDGDGKNPRKPFDKDVFTNSYISFVQKVKSKYPNAQIALLSSPMVGGDKGEVFQSCILEVKKAIDSQYPKDKPVATFFVKPMNPRGCSWHPSVEDHAILAEELLPFFKKLLE